MNRVVLTLFSLGFFVAGCSDNTPEPESGGAPVCDDPTQLCLEPPASGIQMRSDGETIQPGQDVEYCEVLQLPGDPSVSYHVTRFEVQMTQNSHHLIVSAAEVGSETEANAEVGAKKKCIGARIYGEDLLGVTGSQQPYHAESFPEGVGRIYHGGQKLIFDYHYLNTTREPIEARAAVNFHTVDASEIDRVAQGFGFYNLGINVPPYGEADFTKTCTFSEDIMVHKVTRHTHQWGTDFDVRFAGGANDGELFFSSDHYEDVDHIFDEPILVKKGEGFTFRCAYNNTTDYPLKFGVKASDEMCILFGTWYAPNAGDEIIQQGCFN